jgi:hypothetical protein
MRVRPARLSENDGLRMNVVFSILRNIVVYCLELIQYVLNRLHQHRFESLSRATRFVHLRLVSFSHASTDDFGFVCDMLLWLAHENEIGDGAARFRIRQRRVHSVVFFANVMQNFPDSVSDCKFWVTILSPRRSTETHTNQLTLRLCLRQSSTDSLDRGDELFYV